MTNNPPRLLHISENTAIFRTNRIVKKQYRFLHTLFRRKKRPHSGILLSELKARIRSRKAEGGSPTTRVNNRLK